MPSIKRAGGSWWVKHRIFQAVLAGEHAIHGFCNRGLQARFYPAPAGLPRERKSRSARVSLIIARLRGHGLVAKVPGSRLYRLPSAATS